MFDRYYTTQKIINNSEMYEEYLRNRKMEFVKQYGTFNFSKLKNINLSSLDKVIHTVQPGERLYNISQRYYNSPEYGWIICYTNRYANEMLIEIGSILNIYMPLKSLIGLI
jgi:hypothetical protein